MEQTLLCDILPDGSVAGTALAVYEYDSLGNPAGPPVFVNPVTGAPYVAQGVLQPCPGDVGCGSPQRFCFVSTAQVDNPGRMYDITVPIAQGFGVQGVVLDLVDHPFDSVWKVTDGDATQFAADLELKIGTQFPGATVTVTPPAGASTTCGEPEDFQIHIECLRLDRTPPTLVQLRYNAGQDLIQNPAYAEQPPITGTEVGSGNCPAGDGISSPDGAFRLPQRQDDPTPHVFGAPGPGTLRCTSVANRGWETDDGNGSFEIWCDTFAHVTQGVTATPRGTPVQEINGTGFAGGGDTIWQTFVAPTSSVFNLRAIIGGRNESPPGLFETFEIKLSTGDTDNTGIGDIINDTVDAPKVLHNANPWTIKNYTANLTAGQTYTFSIKGPGPAQATVGSGGLFTDMRAFIDAPNTLANFTNNDDTCTVESTDTNVTCEFWVPRCSNGEITGWYNTADGEELTNAAFWAQVPAPQCCETVPGGEAAGGGSSGNLVHTYLVCGNTESGTRTLSRVVITDGSGGAIAEQFVDTSGALVTPTSWQPGECSDAGSSADTEVVQLCDDGTSPPTPYLRRITFNETGFPVSSGDTDLSGMPYVLTGSSIQCPECAPIVLGEVCVASSDFPGAILPATAVQDCDGVVRYLNVSTGAPWTGTVTVVVCPPENTHVEEILCDQGNGGQQFRRVYNVTPLGSVVSYDEDFDTNAYVVIGPVAACDTDQAGRDAEQQILCDNNGPFIRRYAYDSDTGLPSGAASDFTLAGAPYVTVGTVLDCVTDPMTVTGLCLSNGTPIAVVIRRDYIGIVSQDGWINLLTGAFTAGNPPAGTVSCGPVQTVRDEELLVLCDATPTRFLRRYNYDAATGSLVSIVNTTLDGSTPFAPVGAVSVCTTAIASDFDFLSTVLCDANGTQFIQRLTFNSSTGAVTATTNTTLTGGAFAPVAPVALCSDCCPQVIGQGCTNTGSGFYTAVRAVNGTVTLIDSVSGATVLAANIVACPSDNTARTLTAQARVLTNGTPWTPGGDVTGTLTSLTVTGTLGLWDMVDQNGTALTGLPAGLSLSWSAEDDNQLTGPTSVTPQAGSTVVASWTQR